MSLRGLRVRVGTHQYGCLIHVHSDQSMACLAVKQATMHLRTPASSIPGRTCRSYGHVFLPPKALQTGSSHSAMTPRTRCSPKNPHKTYQDLQASRSSETADQLQREREQEAHRKEQLPPKPQGKSSNTGLPAAGLPNQVPSPSDRTAVLPEKFLRELAEAKKHVKHYGWPRVPSRPDRAHSATARWEAIIKGGGGGT